MTKRIIQFLENTFTGIIGYRTYIDGIENCYRRLFFILATNLFAGSTIAQLKSTDEIIKQTVEFETRDFELFTDNTYTPVTTYKGNTYFVWVDSKFRPRVGKIANGKVSVTYLDNDPKYRVLDNNHHRFSIGVDKDGYLHITGDMHHYPKSAVDHLPEKYQDGIIMYWVSDGPGDISRFSWMGKDKDRALPGYGFTYLSFQHDMDGELYARCRNRVYQGPHAPGEMGYSIYRYDTQNRKWTNLGGKAPSNPPAQWNTVIWEDNAHEKKVTNPNFYQGFLGQMKFDFNNRLHVAGTINNNTLYDAASHVIYAYSDDLGNTFHRADGSKIESLPIRVDPGPGQGDIIDGPDQFATYASASYDMEGNPIVTYTRMNEKQSFGMDNSTFKYFNKGTWSKKKEYPTGGHVKNIPVLDANGVLSFLNNAGHVHRTFQIDQQGYTIDLGGNFMSLDERALREENVLRGMMLKDGKLQIIRVEFTPKTNPLPAPWDHRQLGTSKGTAGTFNNVMQLKTSGRGFVNNNIEAQFCYQALSGNGQIEFRVLNVNHASDEAFAGVMISESPDGEAAFMSSVITSHNGIKTFYREGNTINNGIGKDHYQPSEWLRLVRDGNSISTYHSANGRNWQLIESRQIDLPQNVYVGMVAASGTANEGHARVDQVTIKHIESSEPKSEAPPLINGKVSHASCAADNGSINLTLEGGTEPFTYKWSNGATTKNLDNVGSGEYGVKVTDANGKTVSKTFAVESNNAQLSVEADIKNTSCTQDNGSIKVQASGGTAPYSYEWSTNARSSSTNKLAAGSYTVVVKDQNGCSKKFAFEVEIDPGEIKLEVAANLTNVSCAGNDGSISLNVTGSNGPYSFVWDHGTTGANLKSLEQGKYRVSITDSHGCYMKAEYSINQNCSDSSDYYYAQDPPLAVAQGAQNFTLSQFEYYPNPVVNYLNVGISVNQSAVISIYIYDLMGRVMMSQDLGVVQSQITEQLPVAQYPAGTYLIRIKVNDEVITKRFIKQ